MTTETAALAAGVADWATRLRGFLAAVEALGPKCSRLRRRPCCGLGSSLFDAEQLAIFRSDLRTVRLQGELLVPEIDRLVAAAQAVTEAKGPRIGRRPVQGETR